MTYDEPDERFYSPAMVHAERELDARIDTAIRTIQETEARLAELEAQDKRDETAHPTDREVARLSAYISEHARTPEWRQVLARIEQGKLDWRDVLASANTDPAVAAAFRSLATLPQPDDEALAEIDSRLDSQATGPAAPEPADASEATGRPNRVLRFGFEDDEETDSLVGRPQASRRSAPSSVDSEDFSEQDSWLR